jgi:hypothetical protein
MTQYPRVKEDIDLRREKTAPWDGTADATTGGTALPRRKRAVFATDGEDQPRRNDVIVEAVENWSPDTDPYRPENWSADFGYRSWEKENRHRFNDPENALKCTKDLFLAMRLPIAIVFERDNVGRIVLSTNIAESSVTIPHVGLVIDTGFQKNQIFSPKLGINQLEIGWVSQASARQRSGRTGRTRPGQVYRLYPKVMFDEVWGVTLRLGFVFILSRIWLFGLGS